jgi:hypothetical protein
MKIDQNDLDRRIAQGLERARQVMEQLPEISERVRERIARMDFDAIIERAAERARRIREGYGRTRK